QHEPEINMKIQKTGKSPTTILALLCLTFALLSASASNVSFSGNCTWEINGSSINIEVGRVDNDDPAGSRSGRLRLRLWATSTRYSGGTINGYVLGVHALDPLAGQYYYQNISGYVSYTAPPAGTYYTTITLEEYTGSGYVIRDYLTFDGTSQFGGGGRG